MSGKIQVIIYDIVSLPAMPQIAVRMVELLNSPGSSADDMARMVSGAPVISARDLNMANSPLGIFFQRGVEGMVEKNQQGTEGSVKLM